MRTVLPRVLVRLVDVAVMEPLVVLVVCFAWAEYLWELFLSLRQIEVYRAEVSVPKRLDGILEADTFHKARLYGLDRAYFGNVKDFFGIVTNTFVICSGWMVDFWNVGEALAALCGFSADNEIVVSCFFMIFLTTLSTIVDLPFSIYYTFVLEEKHGFNKQTAGFFIKDRAKSFVVSQIIFTPIVAGLVYIVQKGGNMFIVWLWSFSCVMVILLIIIYPSVIAPMFDKYSPLPEGSLRTSIENLAATLKFPLGQLYVVEGSKRSAHSNAYFYGLFGSKRIVLFDTLLENYKKSDDENVSVSERDSNETGANKKGCTDPEVLAVLAHELGHWSHGHIYFNLFIMQINLLLTFLAFGFMFEFPSLYTALGFPPGVQPILVGLVAILHLILAPYNSLLSFGMTILSRRFEFQADNFALSLGHAEPLQKALIKLNKDNLNFPIYDSLYSAWHHSHPTLLQRLENLKKKKD